MNYDVYLELLRDKILDEKLNGNRFHLIRRYQKELDMIIESKNKGINVDYTSMELENDITNSTINDLEPIDKDVTINQLEKYLIGLRNHSRTHRDKLVEVKHTDKVKFINLEERMSLEEIEAIDKEIEFIENQIKNLKNG